MKINQLFILLCLATMLTSCTSHEPEQEMVNQKSTDPTAGIVLGNLYLTEKFKTEHILPFVVDTAVLFSIEKGDSLGTNEVKALDKNWSLRDSLQGVLYALADFYKIDSIKASGNYAAWCDSLQAGNTQRCNAYAIGKIRADDITTLLVWGMVTSSYEACPYFSTTSVHISILRDGAISQSFQLAEYITSGDPPVSMQRLVKGKINKDLRVEIDLYEEGDEDMDQPEIIVTREHYEYALKDGKLALLKQKKEAPVKINRKKKLL